MSVLAYPPTNEEEAFRHCTRECGIITASADQQLFALGCLFCSEKFLYFDAFISHMQTDHIEFGQKGAFSGMFDDTNNANSTGGDYGDEDLTDAADPSQMVVVKQETMEDDQLDDEPFISGMTHLNATLDIENSMVQAKKEQLEAELTFESEEQSYLEPYSSNYDDYGAEDDDGNYDDTEDTNYDDLVEESLLGGTGLTMHIKDRKMIQFLIDSYKRNSFLWDHRHPQFRDRVKRQKFLDWIIMEFKCRFNLSLAKDAVTRKWDNLRTVYKRECNRMALEKTNVSTLWYFKELHFLNRLYGGSPKISEAVVKESVYRRRYSALWNDVSTCRLLSLVEQYPCFYDKYNADYRSKEKRGEALQLMAIELQKMIEVTTIQISKRISQLRFDYSKQKQERLLCEQGNKIFVPSYTYYDQMFFMDADVAPFKCDYCTLILQTPRELEGHVLTHHQPAGVASGANVCPVCHISCQDVDEFNRHKQIHLPPVKETRFHCDLCTASFREKTTYDEHMRRHNDELFLPVISSNNVGSSNTNHVDKAFANQSHLSSHRTWHSGERSFSCDYPHCGRIFSARQSMMEHVKQHYSDDEHKCDVCGKAFKSSKNLQNHKQIHDAIKRYVCKICGSAFAQAAGLYLHKRRHNRPNSRIRQTYQNYN